MAGLPYIRFYGTDWRSDPRLRLCSPAARGVWIDAISLMMEAEPYGHLVIDGRPMTPEQFAALTATSLKITRDAFAELRRHGVSSETEAGVVFSRRMVRDKAKLDAAKEHGKRGGNPRLKEDGNGDGKPPPKTGPLTPPDNLALVKPESIIQKPESRRSSASGSEESPRTPEPPAEPPQPDPALELIRAFDAERVAVFGVALARSNPAANDLPVARRWRESGADVSLCRAVFAARFRAQQASGKAPSGTLEHMDHAVANALAAGKQPMPKADPPGASGYRNGAKPRELSEQEKREKLEEWGLDRAGLSQVRERVRAEGLEDRWTLGR